MFRTIGLFTKNYLTNINHTTTPIKLKNLKECSWFKLMGFKQNCIQRDLCKHKCVKLMYRERRPIEILRKWMKEEKE